MEDNTKTNPTPTKQMQQSIHSSYLANTLLAAFLIGLVIYFIVGTVGLLTAAAKYKKSKTTLSMGTWLSSEFAITLPYWCATAGDRISYKSIRRRQLVQLPFEILSYFFFFWIIFSCDLVEKMDKKAMRQANH